MQGGGEKRMSFRFASQDDASNQENKQIKQTPLFIKFTLDSAVYLHP
jgi:hypothetical protein